MTVVVVIIFGQTWLVRHAAKSHNHAREARADGNRSEADNGITRRNRYIALTAVIAAAITSGMICVAFAALGDVTVGTTVVMVFLATVTGVAETSDTLRDKTFPDICNTTQEAVGAIYSFYAIVRLLIGGLSADPRPRPPRRLARTPTAPSTDTSGPASRAPARSISSRSSTVGTGWPKSRSSGRTFSTGSRLSPRTRGASPVRSKPKSRRPR